MENDELREVGRPCAAAAYTNTRSVGKHVGDEEDTAEVSGDWR